MARVVVVARRGNPLITTHGMSNVKSGSSLEKRSSAFV